MKKITKKIMALMLSLVMVLGCVPSFINEVSAEPTPRYVYIKNVKGGVPKGNAEFYLDTTALYPTQLLHNGELFETFEVGETYVATFMTFSYSATDELKIGDDGSSNVKLTSEFTKGTGFDANTYGYGVYGNFVLSFTVIQPEPIENITLGTEGDLAYDLPATLAATVPDDANYTIESQTGWYDNDGLTGTALSSTDTVNNRTTYYKKIVLKGKSGYEFTDATQQLAVTSIPGVNIASQGLEGNKYSLIISKLADGKTNITFTNFDTSHKVGEFGISSYTIVGSDNKTYTKQTMPMITNSLDNYFRVYDEYGSMLSNEDTLKKEKTYKVQVITGIPSDFLDGDSNHLSNWDQLGLTDTFNNIVSGTEIWIPKDSKIETWEYQSTTYLKFSTTLESRYIKEIQLDGEGTFESGAKTTYVYKAPENANYRVLSTTWYPTDVLSLTLGETPLAPNTTYTAIVVIKPNDGYKFSCENNYYEYVPKISSYDGVPTGYLKRPDEENLTCLVKKETPKTTTLTVAPIKNKQDYLNVKGNIGQNVKFDPAYCESINMFSEHYNGIADQIGLYNVRIEVNNSEEAKKIDTDSISQLIYNGQTYDVKRTVPDEVDNLYSQNGANYLKDNKVLAVTNKSKLSDAFLDYQAGWEKERPGTIESPKATIYLFYDFGKPGNITFSGMVEGNYANSITASGNLGTDGTVSSGTYEIGTVESSVYTKIDNPGQTKLEEGKQYQIRYSISNDKYDINELTINGKRVSMFYNELLTPTMGTSCVYNNDDLTQNLLITYNFTPQKRSSGGSSYKAVIIDKTTEKITGSGSKGSKRVLIPQEGRKVASVEVTDKKGNKIDVTDEKDGTYSFIQPASDVEVKVNYRLRLIELTIGSLDASVDGTHHTLDVVPKVVNDRTMLPIRFVAENLGAKVEWDEKSPEYVLITKGNIKIEITLGSGIAKVNGKEYKLDSIAFAENDRTYLPVRFVSENLNAIVEWNEEKPMEVKIYER